jgi:hypothetical protein
MNRDFQFIFQLSCKDFCHEYVTYVQNLYQFQRNTYARILSWIIEYWRCLVNKKSLEIKLPFMKLTEQFYFKCTFFAGEDLLSASTTFKLQKCVFSFCILNLYFTPILMIISSCSLSNTCMTAWKCDFWFLIVLLSWLLKGGWCWQQIFSSKKCTLEVELLCKLHEW